MTAEPRGAERGQEFATVHINRGPGQSYFETVAVEPGDDVRSVAVKVLSKLADELRQEREGPAVSLEWPEEFQCPHCGAWTGVDDDYQRVQCVCGWIIAKADVARVADPAPQPIEGGTS
jgi:hypothetical protein